MNVSNKASHKKNDPELSGALVILSRFLGVLEDACLLLPAGAVALLLFVCQLYHLYAGWHLVLLIFCCFQFVYFWHGLVVRLRGQNPKEGGWQVSFFSPRLIYLSFLSGLLLGLLWQTRWPLNLFLESLLLAGVVYHIPWLPSKKGLKKSAKEIPYLKAFAIALGVGSVLVISAFLHDRHNLWVLFLTPDRVCLLFLFTHIFTNTCLGDVRDQGRDAQHGIATLPVLLGHTRLRRGLLVLNASMLFITPAIAYMLYIQGGDRRLLDGGVMIAIASTLLVNVALIFFFNPRRQARLFNLIDLNLFPPALVLGLFRGWSSVF